MSADVRSIAAVIDWRADLTNYSDLLAEATAGVDLEIRRAYDWLEEQLAKWRRAIRECEEEVVRAKAELSQRKFQTWDGRDPDCTVQEKNLRLAKARLEHAEEKVELTRRWIGRLPKLIDETFTGPSRRLKTMLEVDVPNALAELARRITALETYASLRPDYAPGPSALAEPTPPAPLALGESEPPAGSPCDPLLPGKGEKEPAELGNGTPAPESATPSNAASPFPSGRGAGGVGSSPSEGTP
jgi:hypothetical protein